MDEAGLRRAGAQGRQRSASALVARREDGGRRELVELARELDLDLGVAGLEAVEAAAQGSGVAHELGLFAGAEATLGAALEALAHGRHEAHEATARSPLGPAIMAARTRLRRVECVETLPPSRSLRER